MSIKFMVSLLVLMAYVCVSFAAEDAKPSTVISPATAAAPAATDPVKRKEEKKLDKNAKPKKHQKANKMKRNNTDPLKHTDPEGMRIPRKGGHTNLDWSKPNGP